MWGSIVFGDKGKKAPSSRRGGSGGFTGKRERGGRRVLAGGKKRQKEFGNGPVVLRGGRLSKYLKISNQREKRLKGQRWPVLPRKSQPRLPGKTKHSIGKLWTARGNKSPGAINLKEEKNRGGGSSKNSGGF